LDVTAAPAAITKLLSWLVGQGFTLAEERFSDRGNQYGTYMKQDRVVTITATRGEWSLGLGMWGQIFHPEQWEAWLDGYPLAGELSGLDQQVAFITHRWEVAIERDQERPEAQAEVAEIGDDWVQRQFGFRPPKPSR
jgi:hypothetical protein